MLASSPMISVSGSDHTSGTSNRMSNASPGPMEPASPSVPYAPPETLKNITNTSAVLVSVLRSFTAENVIVHSLNGQQSAHMLT